MYVSTGIAPILSGPGGKSRSRAWRAGMLLAVLATSAIACKAGGAGEPMRLRIGISQWPGFDILYHARNEGYFEKRGLDVQLMHFDNQQDASRAVVLGSLDAAFVSIWDTIQVVPGNDSPAFILVTNVSRGADGIVARPGIASLPGLRGKRIATKLGTVNQLILLEALAVHRMTPGDVQIVDIHNELAERRMHDGSIDASVTWEPTMSRIAATTGGSIVYTTRDVDSLVVDGLATSKKALHEKREALIRLLLVWFDVMHDLETRPDQVYASAGAAIGVDAETFARSYAGIERGDRDLNREMFDQGRLLRTIEAQTALIRTHPLGSTVRADLVVPSDFLAAALERWRPGPSPSAPASK
jgi:NitT/TauT family transport system substrate-binding protein